EELTDVVFYKVDIDEEMELAQRYQIMSVPTLLFLKNGEVVNKSVGAIPMEQLKDIIASIA
ncbi:MAG TPA: thioredoxin family protein, partial [Candidatus Pelethocola excrementipullorum]|nr:thioredoxin family protein [Candidatus Pelethocola excrementipullorum]